jgi:hypothetical protein
MDSVDIEAFLNLKNNFDCLGCFIYWLDKAIWIIEKKQLINSNI